jgi:uncharacterized protein YecE (DUF72 family)
MQLFVGQAGLVGDMVAYVERFDMLELSSDTSSLPRLTRLRAWRRQAPEEFVFSVRLPRVVSGLSTGNEAEAALSGAMKIAEALRARWLVLSTPPEVTPCQRTRQRLGGLVAKLASEPYRVAWEPRGLWEDPQEEELARELGLVLVRDLRRRPRPPQSQVIYTRLLALGASARQSDDALVRMWDRMAESTEAFVVVEGSGARRAHDFLHQLEP